MDCADREVSDAELSAAHGALTCWQTPQEFVSRVEGFAPLVRSSTLFNRGNAGFLLDAIPIAEFTKRRTVQLVRMVKQTEKRNDGQIQNAGETIDIEVTEILDPGRKRGHEYRCEAEQGVR